MKKGTLLLIFILTGFILISGCNIKEPDLKKIPFKFVEETFQKDGQLSREFSQKPIIDVRNVKDIDKEYKWFYFGREWKLTMSLNKETFDSYRLRERRRDFDLFASDPYDDEIIERVADLLDFLAKKEGLDNKQIPFLAVSFVQSLPSTEDDVTAGFDEYPRFPYETLFEEGGDCEDTSILVAALLKEMGYGVLLIELPGHMAVGVKCEDEDSYSYDYFGQRYCYLETTGENWDIGKIPEVFIDKKADLVLPLSRPALFVDFTSDLKYNPIDTFVDVDVTVRNLGTEIAKNVTVYVALQTRDLDREWDSIEEILGDIPAESGYNYKVSNLHAPSEEDFRVFIKAYGDNVVSDEYIGKWKSD